MSDSTATTLVRVRSRVDLEQAVRRAGAFDNELASLRLAEAKAKAKITAKYAAQIAAAEQTRDEQVERVRLFIADNVGLVFGSARKSVTDAGELALKKLPTRVVVADEDAAIRDLEGRDLDAYLRHTTALDKRALLKDRVQGEGISYLDRDQLVIVPITSGDRIAIDL